MTMTGAELLLSRSADLCILDLLKRRAEVEPTAVAIAAPGRRPLSYGRLLQQVQSTVRSLAHAGLAPGDRVALVLPNGPEMAVAFLAVAAGATCAPLNPAYTADEIYFYLADLKARAVIIAADEDTPARAVALARGLPVLDLAPTAEAEAGTFLLHGTGDKILREPCYASPSDTALVLHTSGTTSRPKIVPLTHANLCSSATSITKTLALTPRDRCLNVMPLFHIHGLIGALLASLAAGGSVVCTRGFVRDKFFAWLDELHPTWYTAAPAIHQAVLSAAADNGEVIARRRLRFIRSSSAALPTQAAKDLEDAFQSPVVEAYSMTEASHQMACMPLPPRPAKPGSVGLPAGPDIAIMDEAGKLLPRGAAGEVVIRGPSVTSGYERNPEANAAAFIDGWFRTGDLGTIDQDGYLFLVGRIKEIINQGGEKVAPVEVDEALSSHPAVAEAVTFAMPHPTLGEAVAAAVVLKRDAHASESELREAARLRLAEFKVPKQIVFLERLPRGPTGKLQRVGLANTLADQLAAKRQQDFVAADTSMEKELVDIWRQFLPAEQIGVRDDFNALGGDSLSMIEMILRVEKRFGATVPIETFLTEPTVEHLLAIVQARDHHPSGAHAASSPITDSRLRGLVNRLLQCIALYIPGNKTSRVWLHRKRGVTVGDNVSFGLSSLIETAYPSLVSIGNNVTIGTRVVVIAHLRDFTDHSRLADRHTVRIEDDVYLGPGVIVLPNVTIGQGTVVSAGSVVTHSLPPRMFVQGNPAKPVARCGVSLGGGVPYAQFLRQLRPLKD